MHVRKIYFDLDGVLADFDRGVRELCGLTPMEQSSMTSKQHDALWAEVKKVEHFYDRLEPMEGACELFREAYEKYGRRCEILTGIPKPKRGIVTAGEDKINWSHRVLAEDVVVNIVFRSQKIRFCRGRGCVLIDDLFSTVNDWRLRGGTGIYHKNAEDTRIQFVKAGIL